MTALRPTIFARSTGTLPSAIAIVRISGSQAGRALDILTGRGLPAPRTAVVRNLNDPMSGEMLDMALVLWLPGPNTVTGEDLVELHCHGGRAVVAAVERALAAIKGLEPAEPGAFTKRAFENGRIDLSQVEGLADLLAAETDHQRRAALIVADGGLRREVDRWQGSLLQLAARAEAMIDFADEGDVGSDMRLQDDCESLAGTFEKILDNPPAERLRDGIRICIAGPPNAGKSTLFNALVGREAAIASPTAGTTRDLIETPVSLGGLPVVFIDMAGLRDDTDDPIEAIGIARAQAAIAHSDIVLWLGTPASAPPGNHVLCVHTKCDLGGERATGALSVSAVTGDNLVALVDAIKARAESLLPAAGSLSLTVAQQAHIQATIAALQRAGVQADDVLRAEDVRAAMRALDRITGAADTEAMLDVLFGRFCIGK